MGKIGGFKEYNRADESNIAVAERVSNYNEFTIPLSKEKIKERVKKYYLNKKEKFNHIQSIIGEPFLKTIIGNYLDEFEQIFDIENYKSNKKQKLLEQFSEKELEEFLESKKNAKA